MLKLPKGLKKKKKGKKSKKDQELFTEEELKQYKREHQAKQQHESESEHTGQVEFEQNYSGGGGSGLEAYSSTAGAGVASAAANTYSTTTTTADSSDLPVELKSEQDEEWSKFKALTAGVDSILHRTQDDLDRIKSTSFFQRLPTTAEKQKQEEDEAQAREAAKQEKERLRLLEVEANRDRLAEAVVELSESEEESEEADDIFNTEYIDAITSGEVQLTVVPDSPDFEVDEGPDPFDTTYAEKLIKGPEVSKRGKKLVSLGSAVQVLTGRVDSAHAVALSGAKRKPRKGVQDLLFENEEDAAYVLEEYPITPEPQANLLDELTDDIPDLPIDLSASLHIPILLQQQQQQKEQDDSQTEGETERQQEQQDQNQFCAADILSEFDVLKKDADDEDDEFAELAVESLAKKEEVKLINNPQTELSGPVEANWAEFEQTAEEKQLEAKQKAKPPRPPPARPSAGPHIPVSVNQIESDDEFEVPEDDPFDTAFVEKVIPVKEVDSEDDFDFDPRAGEEKPPAKDYLSCAQKDLLGGSVTDLSALPQVPIIPVQETVEDFDPFDTSAISSLVEPKELELKFLEKELLADHPLKKSLSDPDFDPRQGEPEKCQNSVVTDFDSARRKSSLSLNIQSKSVGFVVPETDLLAVDNESSKIQKPLTPYYAKPQSIQEKDIEDPFDTSFVPSSQPSSIELRHIENDLLSTNLKHSLSDPDFDPRAFDLPLKKIEQSDLLSVEDNINIKVLTPAHEKKVNNIDEYSDPFDTSIALNLQPGKTELKLLENELLPPTKPEITTGVLDTLTDAQELGLGDKVLTPQAPIKPLDSIEDIDPFDTSFAANLGPGETEIKLLESELIEKH